MTCDASAATLVAADIGFEHNARGVLRRFVVSCTRFDVLARNALLADTADTNRTKRPGRTQRKRCDEACPIRDELLYLAATLA
jgi:hypothetical protein